MNCSQPKGKLVMNVVADTTDFMMVWVLVMSVLVLIVGHYLWGYIKTRCVTAPDAIDAYIVATRLVNTQGHLVNNLEGERKESYSLETYPMLLRVKRQGREYNLKQRDVFTMMTPNGLRCIAVGQLVNYDRSEECVTIEYTLSGNDLTDFKITSFPMDETITEFILSYRIVKNVPQTYRTKLEHSCRNLIDAGIGED